MSFFNSSLIHDTPSSAKLLPLRFKYALCICASNSARNSSQSSDYPEESARIVYEKHEKDLMYNWRVAVSLQTLLI